MQMVNTTKLQFVQSGVTALLNELSSMQKINALNYFSNNIAYNIACS